MEREGASFPWRGPGDLYEVTGRDMYRDEIKLFTTGLARPEAEAGAKAPCPANPNQ